MPEKKQPITVLPIKLFGVHNTDRMSDVISSASGQNSFNFVGKSWYFAISFELSLLRGYF